MLKHLYIYVIFFIYNATALTKWVSYITDPIVSSYNYVTCADSECCPATTNINDWMPVDLLNLKYKLKKELFGQPLVYNVVTRAIKYHYKHNEHSQKALVMSFHGPTGVGKNYASSFIAESLYVLGMKSKFVHLFMATAHFPYEHQSDLYKYQIQNWIRGNVSLCPNSLFIFDEIDKMPAGVIEAIKPFTDYNYYVDGLDFTKTTFIFLSNTGASRIINKVLQFWRNGKNRDTITYFDMEQLVLEGAFNEAGGLSQSSLIMHHLIDFYVPFLPLEKDHVTACVRAELQRRNKNYDSDIIEKVVGGTLFSPESVQLFAQVGCKGVPSKVTMALVEKHDEL